jgi:hypothetical protein
MATKLQGFPFWKKIETDIWKFQVTWKKNDLDVVGMSDEIYRCAKKNLKFWAKDNNCVNLGAVNIAHFNIL